MGDGSGIKCIPFNIPDSCSVIPLILRYNFPAVDKTAFFLHIFVVISMGEILSRLTESGQKGGGILRLIWDEKGQAPRSPEGYLLKISDRNAEIISRGEAGLFYGCQTLEQLLEDARDFQTSVPACEITDCPALPYRAVHLDVKHHLDHRNYYYESMDRLARYKINAVIFEFTY